MIRKGKRYRVVSDAYRFFKPGEIVVSIEDAGTIAWFVREPIYVSGKTFPEYEYSDCGLLCDFEVEEMEKDNVKE